MDSQEGAASFCPKPSDLGSDLPGQQGARLVGAGAPGAERRGQGSVVPESARCHLAIL